MERRSAPPKTGDIGVHVQRSERRSGSDLLVTTVEDGSFPTVRIGQRDDARPRQHPQPARHLDSFPPLPLPASLLERRATLSIRTFGSRFGKRPPPFPPLLLG